MLIHREQSMIWRPLLLVLALLLSTAQVQASELRTLTGRVELAQIQPAPPPYEESIVSGQFAISSATDDASLMHGCNSFQQVQQGVCQCQSHTCQCNQSWLHRRMNRLRSVFSKRKRCARCSNETEPQCFPEVCEPPVGSSVADVLNKQIARGEASLMMLYRYDFVPGSPQLNATGETRLSQISRQLPRNLFPLVIQPTLDRPQLDEQRRRSIHLKLAKGPFPVPVERIVLGSPPARSLDGVDAEAFHARMLRMSGTGGDEGASGYSGTPQSSQGGEAPKAR